MRAWAKAAAKAAAKAGARPAEVLLIDPDCEAYYSGMLPGHIAGHYPREALIFDLPACAAAAGVRYLRGRVTALDPAKRQITLRDAEGHEQVIGYEIASLDIGIHSAMPEIKGFCDHATPVKPLAAFARAWERFASAPSGPICVIGGGVAGVEIALAAAHRLAAHRLAGQAAGTVHLVEAGPCLAPLLSPRARAQLERALRRFGVQVHLAQKVAEVTATQVILETGAALAAGMVIGAGGARPHAWLAQSGLTDARGFVPVGETLQTTASPTLFAVGDCAEMTHAPRPKAGVFAVRQAPILAQNLSVLATGKGALARYWPQRDYLKLISLGETRALADWHGLALQGRWLWRWKDRIDRGFMAGD